MKKDKQLTALIRKEFKKRYFREPYTAMTKELTKEISKSIYQIAQMEYKRGFNAGSEYLVLKNG